MLRRGAPTHMPAVLETLIGNGEAKRLSRIMRPFEAAAAFVARNHDDLLQRYPEQWIAVSGSEVIATSPTKQGLARKLRNLKVDAGDLDVTFLTTRPQTLIL
jgi:hypothetical protein